MRAPRACFWLLVCCTAAVEVGGCARPARPAVMVEADQTRRGPGLEIATQRAPEAIAHADKLRADAERAYASGDVAGAQILAERAMVAYEHARVLARVAQANERVGRAKVTQSDSERQAAETEAEQKRVAAETEDVEVRLKAMQDAEALTAIGPADPGRERARLSVARSLALDARMLCTAAQMIGAKPESIAEPKKAAEAAFKSVAVETRPAPLEAAMRARADCLAVLTNARRTKAAMSSQGRADELLAQISAMGGLAPSRDERGVVVTLRGLFDKGELRSDGEQRLRTLGRVAQAHPDFPVQVLVHGAKPGAFGSDEIAREQAQADGVAKMLVEAGAKAGQVQSDVAAGAHPIVVDGKGASRNERIEITFVDPGG